MVFLALKWEDQSQASVWKINENCSLRTVSMLSNSGSEEEQHALYHMGWNMEASIHDFYLLVKNKLKI